MSAHRRDQMPTVARAHLAELPAMLRAERTRRGVSMREAAAEIGLGYYTIQRIEAGNSMDLAAFLAIVVWLRLDLSWFVGPTAVRHQDAYRRGWDDCAAAVRAATERAA